MKKYLDEKVPAYSDSKLLYSEICSKYSWILKSRTLANYVTSH